MFYSHSSVLLVVCFVFFAADSPDSFAAFVSFSCLITSPSSRYSKILTT